MEKQIEHFHIYALDLLIAIHTQLRNNPLQIIILSKWTMLLLLNECLRHV